MKKLLFGLLLINFTLFSQVQDSVSIHNKDYKKVTKVTLGEVLKTVDSLYNVNPNYYNAFYLINKKDTLYIKRKETYTKIFKVINGKSI